MVQFNLLPDVKLQFIKARRTKRMMELISIVVVIASLAVFVLMITTVDIVQKKSLKDLDKDITTNTNQLKSTQDLSKILTVQNQLKTLTNLNDSKIVSSRVFGYLTQITPAQVSISKFTIDFVGNTVVMSGQAPDLGTINTFTDTLKATTYTTDTNTTALPAFTKVVLGSFGRNKTGAAYSITFNFDPLIFNTASKVTLKVPAQSTVDPASLFQKQVGGTQ